jgi:hypothetical protein
MTVGELSARMNAAYGLNPWPAKLEVDADTYANVSRYLFAHSRNTVGIGHGVKLIEVYVGPNDGPMFKNVELILVNQ